MPDKNEQTDDDIKQCKADILRARDIIPGTPTPDEGHADNPVPKENKEVQQPETQRAGEDTIALTGPAPTSAERNKPSEEDATTDETQAEKARHKESEIPSFDLAREIMAEQRRITAIRRKSPGEKTEARS